MLAAGTRYMRYTSVHGLENLNPESVHAYRLPSTEHREEWSCDQFEKNKRWDTPKRLLTRPVYMRWNCLDRRIEDAVETRCLWIPIIPLDSPLSHGQPVE